MSRIKCEILEATPQRIKFVLNNCDVSLANSLRRILIAEVPTMAPHLISVYQNTSVLHDEFLAQRIGLIPFNSQQVDSHKYPWNCDCSAQNIDDCQICKLQFRLQVHHKGASQNGHDNIREVTSLDIQQVPIGDEGESQYGRNPVLPVKFYSEINNGKIVGIPIVKLNRNEQINIRFDVQKGTGKMHAKWSPVSLATFQPDPQIKVNHEIETTLDDKIAIKESCPTKVFEIHNGTLEAVNSEKCIFCGQCQKKAELINMQKLKNYIQIGKKKDRFIFIVESVGGMAAGTIVKKAMSVLREKLESIQKMIDKA